MKRFRGIAIVIAILMICAVSVQLVLSFTAKYPPLAEPVTHKVNEIEGFTLKIEGQTWSPFSGYTWRYNIETASEQVYHFTVGEGRSEIGLERFYEGKWYRVYGETWEPFNTNVFDLGGAQSESFSGSIVQKDSGYGTRLKEGEYRLTVALQDDEGKAHYLATEFEID